MPGVIFHRWHFAAFALLALGAPLARGQAAADTDAPKLDQAFTFTLSPHRDYALEDVITSVKEHDDFQRSQELESANASVVSEALDLLRYVPVNLREADEDLDDFFTPQYLRPEYARLPADPHLFDSK